MKKLLLSAIVVLSAFITSYAQIDQGTILVGAGSNFNFTNVDPDGGDSFTKFKLQGKAGYFFAENVVGGLKLDYAKNALFEDVTETGFGLFGRYYANNVIIIGASLGTYSVDFGPVDASSTVFGLEGGYAAFITDNIAIEPTLNIDFYSGDIDMSQFGVNVGISLYLGRD